VLFVSAASMVAGFLLLGFITGRLNRLGISTPSVSFTGMLCFTLALLWIQIQPGEANLLAWAVFGFFGTSGTLMFAGLSQQFPVAISARVSTSLNLGIFLGAFIVQWGVGAVISLWPSEDGQHYPATAFRWALAGATLLQVSGLLWYLICRWRGARQASNAANT
jgi:hypothetical protein